MSLTLSYRTATIRLLLVQGSISTVQPEGSSQLQPKEAGKRVGRLRRTAAAAPEDGYHSDILMPETSRVIVSPILDESGSVNES